MCDQGFYFFSWFVFCVFFESVRDLFLDLNLYSGSYVDSSSFFNALNIAFPTDSSTEIPSFLSPYTLRLRSLSLSPFPSFVITIMLY